VNGPLRLAAVDEDQKPLLDAFRAAHPEVLMGSGEFGTWQAIIPEENGETIVVRYTLRELLNKLDELFPDLRRLAWRLTPPGVARLAAVPGWQAWPARTLPKVPSRVPRPGWYGRLTPCWGRRGAGLGSQPPKRALPGTALGLAAHSRRPQSQQMRLPQPARACPHGDIAEACHDR
jgi:hypothetical protein